MCARPYQAPTMYTYSNGVYSVIWSDDGLVLTHGTGVVFKLFPFHHVSESETTAEPSSQAAPEKKEGQPISRSLVQSRFYA